MEVTHKTMEDNSRNISLIGEVENSSREQAFVAQRLETGFLTVRSRVRFPPGSVGAHCWRVPNRTKQLSSAPSSFRFSTLLINDGFPIEDCFNCNYEFKVLRHFHDLATWMSGHGRDNGWEICFWIHRTDFRIRMPTASVMQRIRNFTGLSRLDRTWW